MRSAERTSLEIAIAILAIVAAAGMLQVVFKSFFIPVIFPAAQLQIFGNDIE